MKSWHIITISVAVAAIVAALLYVPAGLPASRADLAVLLHAQWPAIAIVRVSSYGVAAVALTTAALTVEIVRARKRIAGANSGDGTATIPRQVLRQWALRYLKRLAITQYFTAIAVLLGLGLS